MLSIEKYLESNCKVNPNEKINTSDDGYWKLKDLIQSYIDEADLVKNNVVLADVSGWLEFYGNEKLFKKMAKKNCSCRFDDATQSRFNDKHPIALLTHFKLV